MAIRRLQVGKLAVAFIIVCWAIIELKEPAYASFKRVSCEISKIVSK